MPVRQITDSVNVELPNLAVFPVDQLIVHEWHDRQRTPPLLKRIQKSGVFRHPPVVTSAGDRSGRYVVLDGANRTAALQSMNCPHIVVQVVEPDDPGVMLRTWNHILLDIDTNWLLNQLQKIPNLDMVSSADRKVELPSKGYIGVALIQTPDGQVYGLSAPGEAIQNHIAVLNQVVDIYKGLALLERTAFNDVDQLIPIFPDLKALVIFPKFNLEDLVRVALTGCLLPPGITRITAAPRALNINLPLEVLMGSENTAQKNVALQALIHERIRTGQVKCYPEATFMFDE